MITTTIILFAKYLGLSILISAILLFLTLPFKKIITSRIFENLKLFIGLVYSIANLILFIFFLSMYINDINIVQLQRKHLFIPLVFLFIIQKMYSTISKTYTENNMINKDKLSKGEISESRYLLGYIFSFSFYSSLSLSGFCIIALFISPELIRYNPF